MSDKKHQVYVHLVPCLERMVSEVLLNPLFFFKEFDIKVLAYRKLSFTNSMISKSIFLKQGCGVRSMRGFICK